MKKILSVILLIVICFSSCDGGEKTNKKINVIADNTSEYIIVRPDSSGIYTMSAVLLLSESIKKNTGVSLPIQTDWIHEEIQQEHQYEILVGATNRTASQTAMSELDEDDYTIGVYGTKVVITGGSDVATYAAVYYFIQTYLKENESDLKIEEDLHYLYKDIDIDAVKRLQSGTPYPVTPVLSAQESSAAINNRVSGSIKKIATETIQISEYDPDWAFTHHAQIAVFKGKIYAAWSNGPQGEEGPKDGRAGYRICLSTSEDFYNWSEPSVLVGPAPGKAFNQHLLAGYFYIYKDRLNFSYVLYDYDDAGAVKNKSYLYIYTEDGTTWSKPMPTLYGAFVTAPRLTSSNRLLWSAGTTLRYTDDLSGFGNWTEVSVKQEYVDAAYQAGALELVEASFYETRDKIIHMVMRGCDGYVWHTESYDNAQTWSPIYKTNFTDGNSKSFFGNLPDGRAFCINTPVNNGSNIRAPLVLSVSEDGYNFSEQYILADKTDYIMQKNGMAKEGYYGYPEAFIDGDYIYVVYSKMKEVIEVLRVKISDLSKPEAKAELIPDVNKGIFYRFNSQEEIANIGIIGNTVLSYDKNENAMKVTITGKSSPGTIVVGGKSTASRKYIFDGTVSTKEYPVLLLRIKKNNYNDKYMGTRYVYTTDSQETPISLYLMHLSNTDEWQTIVIDLSFIKSHTAAGYALFTGNYTGIRFGLPSAGKVQDDTTFWVRWLAVFPNVQEAMNYAYSIKDDFNS